MAMSLAKERKNGKWSIKDLYKIILVGETGAGKTYFLNLLCNCGMVRALGCKFDEDGLARFEQFNDIKLENAQSCKMQSKTTGAKLYEADIGDLKVGIIDTPGFGDSRGMEQDKKNAKAIIDTLKDEEYINCVCLVINGRQSRMSATLQYVLTEITSILPKEVLSNIIVVFTNTADPLDLNFDVTELKKFFGKSIDLHFYIENPYCRLEKLKFSKFKITESLKHHFKETTEVLADMSTTIKNFKTVHAHQFTSLYEKKQHIDLSIFSLSTLYSDQEIMEKLLADAQEEVDTALRSKMLNETYRSTSQIKRMITVRTAGHNTVCGAPSCYSNCHMGCNLPKSFDKEVFKYCQAFGGLDSNLGFLSHILASISLGNCQECGHHYSYHYHNEVRFEEEVYSREYVDENKKRQFEEAKIKEEKAKSTKKNFEARCLELEKEKIGYSQKLCTKISEFQRLGINNNYAKLIENQLEVINLHLDGTTGDEVKHLRRMKQEFEKRLRVVQDLHL